MNTVKPCVINPDDYLETPTGRVFTPQRNRDAWQQACQALEIALSTASSETTFYVVMGVQGAGKSTWINHNLARLGNQAIVFDAALPKAVHREKLLERAQHHGVPVVAVFLNVSLEVALQRNARRPADKVVPEPAVRSVFAMIEVPSHEEGFAAVWSVNHPGEGL